MYVRPLPTGPAARCSGHRQRLPGNGHGGRSGGCMERGVHLGEEVNQGPGGKFLVNCYVGRILQTAHL